MSRISKFSRAACAATVLSLAASLLPAASSFAQTTPAPAATATPVPPVKAGPHPMNLDDVDHLVSVGSPRVSPDGKWVLYTVSTIDTTADKRITDIWMVSWDGAQDIRLTYNTDTSASDPKVKGSQVWVLDRRGGEARQLTDVKGNLSSYDWSPDAKKLLLTISEDVEAEAKDKAKADDKDKDAKDKPRPIVIYRYHFKRDIEGFLSADTRPDLLYLYDTDSKKLDKLTTDKVHPEEDAAWSPDGSKVAFVSNHDADPDRSNNTDIFVVDAKPNSSPIQLTKFKGADEGPLSWSPDSKFIAYIQGSEPKFDEYSERKLAIVPAAGGEPVIRTTAFDRPVRDPLYAPDGNSINVVVSDDRSQYLAAVPSASAGDVKRLIDQPGRAAAPDEAAGHTALLWTTDAAPAELFALEDGKLRKLTSHNDALVAKLQLGATRDLQAKAADGTDVHALVTVPVGYVAGQKYPMLLFIHGGPDSQDAHGFDPMRQLFAGKGYAMLNVNYRGSNGRGKAYQQAIVADWGNKEVVDLLAAVDEAVKEGIADPDRLGVGGWSYGGMLTDYTIATTTRFKAAISGAGTGNPLGFYGVDMYILQFDNEIGPPWKNLDTYLKISYPFLHADRIQTPTLFMGGDKDFNVPINGGEQMYQALRSLNVPTELIIYPGQFHQFTRPSFIRDRYQRWFDWYDRYLMPKGAGK